MWPLLIVNYVKLIELKRLLVYSKESCNNLANIIHGHRRFRIKRPLNNLHSAATGGRPGRGRGEEGRVSVSDGHLTRGWHNVTISGSDPGVWVRHVTWTIALSQDNQTESQGNMSFRRIVFCVYSVFWILTLLLSLDTSWPGPGSDHTNTRAWPLGPLNCYYWLSQPGQAQPSITRTHPDGARKYFEHIFTAHNIISVNTNIFSHRGFKVGEVKIKLFSQITNYFVSRGHTQLCPAFLLVSGCETWVWKKAIDCHKISQGLESC